MITIISFFIVRFYAIVLGFVLFGMRLDLSIIIAFLCPIIAIIINYHHFIIIVVADALYFRVIDHISIHYFVYFP